MSTDGPVTALLHQWRAGDDRALEQLTPIVYAELRRRAQRIFNHEQPGHTLQPTALVHEAYDRLASAQVDWQDRAHFYALCSRMMRRILVDHAKAKGSHKRDGGQRLLTVDMNALGEGEGQEGLLDLDQAMERLARRDNRLAELIDLQLFGGLSYKELEAVTGLSSSTLDRQLRFAKAWLKSHLEAYAT
ncbi:ECF-type sigma factor [Gallaecimonas sp. GXIMD4217]|uniref:ECF-type sigma factor n=1 Tax=Gallaecimonas sp. GXIMD4217 TaxID=3131927 RepID=UPI00311B358F